MTTDRLVMLDLFPATVRHDAGGRQRPSWRTGSVIEVVWAGPLDAYRLWLSETWDVCLPTVMFQMMNPSVAGVEHADPTLLRTGAFARAWGFGRQLIGNDHAYRATDKNRLLEVDDPVGPGNDDAILAMARDATMIVLAQGQPPKRLQPRSAAVVRLLRDAGHGRKLHVLKRAKNGAPWHPLYVAADVVPQRWDD